MSLSNFQTRAPEIPTGSNGYEVLTEAIRHLKWMDDGELAPLLYSSFTERQPFEVLSEDDVQRMHDIVVHNQKAIELVGQSILREGFIVPSIRGSNPRSPVVRETLHIMSRFPALQLVCYLEARLLIHQRQWNRAINAIDCMFRYAHMLQNAWQDFTLPLFGEQTERHGYKAVMELALQRDVDPTTIRRILQLLQNSPISEKTYLEARLRPFWSNIVAFLEHLDDCSDGQAVVLSLLENIAIRQTLTNECLVNADVDSSGGLQPLYPAMTLEDEGEANRDALLLATRWVSERCDVPFDKKETVSILEKALASIFRQGMKGPHMLRQHLDLETSRRSSSCRFSALMCAAAAKSIFQVKQLLADIANTEINSPRGRLPSNVIGMVLAADIVSACHADLLTSWLISQATLLQREVCRTMVAIAAHVRLEGTLPGDLGLLVTRGYLDRIPSEPYTGGVLCYDPQRRRVYLNAEVSNVVRYGAPDDDEDAEISWYLNMA